MKAYNQITCRELLAIIKNVFDVSSVKEKRREYVATVSVWCIPLLVHVCKSTPKDWRVTTASGETVDGFEWDAILLAVNAINDELDRHYY